MTIQITHFTSPEFGDWEVIEKTSANTTETSSSQSPRTSVSGNAPSSGVSLDDWVVLNANDAAVIQAGMSSEPSPRDVTLGLPNESSRTSVGEKTTSGAMSDDWVIPDADEITKAKEAASAAARLAAQARREEIENKLDFLRSWAQGGAVAPKERTAQRSRSEKASPQTKPATVSHGKSVLDKEEIQKGFTDQLNEKLNDSWRWMIMRFLPTYEWESKEAFQKKSAEIGGEQIKQDLQACLNWWIDLATAEAPDGLLTEEAVDDIKQKLMALVKDYNNELYVARRAGRLNLSAS